MEVFQKIAPELNRCIYSLIERLIKKTRSSIERIIVSKNLIKQLKHVIGIALQPLFNNTEQQHTPTATSIPTTISTYRSLSAQWLSERTVLQPRTS
jgi:hypothetical protein